MCAKNLQGAAVLLVEELVGQTQNFPALLSPQRYFNRLQSYATASMYRAMRRYLSADGDATVDDDDVTVDNGDVMVDDDNVTVDIGDVKIDTIRLPSAKPIMRGPRYHAHTRSCGHVCAEMIQKIENRLGEALKL